VAVAECTHFATALFVMEVFFMECIKLTVKSSLLYIRTLLKWTILATLVGLAGGIIGSLFHESVEIATSLREEKGWLIYLLPLGGVVIAFIYALSKKKGRIDTNRVIESARDEESVPLVMAPLIFVSTVITHLLGGSAGREGAALQLGGSIGYNMGRLTRLNKNDMHIIVMSGMSSVFAALFGTPLTAAFFAIEVVSVGIIHYGALVPCILSSIVAYEVALRFGISPVKFSGIAFEGNSVDTMVRVIVLSVLCAVVGILFCSAIKRCEHIMEKYLPGRYLRAITGGLIIVLLTAVLSTHDYNGAGMDVITRAIEGDAKWEACILKIIFTAITIAAGFKGGEIVPSFFIGSTFGCVAGSLLGLSPSFGAAIGFVALFCGVVNCPFASLMLALEVFGTEAILAFAAVCGVSYMMSGYSGLYKSQKIM